MKESMHERITILRHLEEDNQDLGVERDGEVQESEVSLVRDHFAPFVAEMCESDNKSTIKIITSDTKRAKTTSELLQSELDAEYGLGSTIIIDPRTEALKHGQYKVGTSPNNPLVKRAQQIYLKETFNKNNPWYRHGSTTSESDGSTYEELYEIFEAPGENQIELSIRFYSFLNELLDDVNQEDLVVLSSHYVILSRLLSLQHISNDVDPLFSLYYNSEGKLYEQEWHAGLEMMGDVRFHDFFRQHNYVFDLNMGKIGKLRAVISTDLEILKAQYMQHYGQEPTQH